MNKINSERPWIVIPTKLHCCSEYAAVISPAANPAPAKRNLSASFTASDHISVLSDRNGELARHKRLPMDISNEVEVATIVFDETEMLEIKEVIALLFQSVDSQCGDGKEIRQKVCCNFRVSVLVIKVVAF